VKRAIERDSMKLFGAGCCSNLEAADRLPNFLLAQS